MSFTARQQVKLAEHGNTDQQIEQYMLDYFTLENGRFFLRLRGYVLGSANLVGWREILEQCFDADDRGHYLVLIPALLSAIEGAVAQNAGKLKVAEIDVRKFAKDLEQAAQQGSMDFLVWRSARVVLDKLFSSSDFGGPQPGKLNRHWILHGRDQTQWNQTDALRLFNLPRRRGHARQRECPPDCRSGHEGISSAGSPPRFWPRARRVGRARGLSVRPRRRGCLHPVRPPARSYPTPSP